MTFQPFCSVISSWICLSCIYRINLFEVSFENGCRKIKRSNWVGIAGSCISFSNKKVVDIKCHYQLSGWALKLGYILHTLWHILICFARLRISCLPLCRSTSEDVLSKPYQNVFNGSMKSGGPEGDNDFDAGYTERLRLLSKQQKYVHTTSPSEAKPLPSQQPSAATRPHSHHQQTSQQQLSPHNSSYSSPVLGGSGGAAQQYQPGAANVSPQQQGYHQASSPYQQQKNLHLQMTNHSASNLRQQQVF